MFSKQSAQKLVHLPRHQQSPRTPDLQLPRGECRYILPDVEADGSRQRCSCVSFSLNQNVPGSMCGCSHQAWHHVTEPAGDYVPAEEHIALLEKVKNLEETSRRLQEDLTKERKERDRTMKHILRGTYSNMANLRFYFDEKIEILRRNVDDKVEGILDKADGAAGEAQQLLSRVADLDEAMMRLEDRVDSGRPRSVASSSSLTPVLQAQAKPKEVPSHPQRPAPELPIRIDIKYPDAWNVRVILVPRRAQQFAFSPDSVAYQRCQTRGLHQDLHLQDHTSQTFVQCTESSFTTIFRGRPWMPLQCLRSSDMSLCQIALDQRDHTLWGYDFLESQCMAHDKLQGDVIFITLQNEDLSWKDIHALPRIFGSEESCWEHNEELEGTSKEELAAMDCKMDTDPIKPALDSDSVYEYSPPPYSRAYADIPRHGLSGLEVLATASSMADTAASISDRSVSTVATSSAASTIGSIDGTMMLDGEYDEHRDKRTKRTGQRQLPSLTLSPPPAPQPLYYSGRAKRKVPTGKQREPLDWRVSEMNLRNPVKGLLHRHESKDKDKRPQTAGTVASASSEASSSRS